MKDLLLEKDFIFATFEEHPNIQFGMCDGKSLDGSDKIYCFLLKPERTHRFVLEGISFGSLDKTKVLKYFSKFLKESNMIEKKFKVNGEKFTYAYGQRKNMTGTITQTPDGKSWIAKTFIEMPLDTILKTLPFKKEVKTKADMVTTIEAKDKNQEKAIEKCVKKAMNDYATNTNKIKTKFAEIQKKLETKVKEFGF